MTAKELKKLKRSDLLEILLARTAEVERLKAELEEANKKLEDRAILLENVGSIAEASLKLNGVFEAAEAAAEQYLKNIERVARGESEIFEPEAPEAEKPEETPVKPAEPKEKAKKKSNSKKPTKAAEPKEPHQAPSEEQTEESPEGAE